MYKVIKSLTAKKWLGLTEKTFEPGKVNIISGRKGIGKTSIIEAIEYALTGRLEDKEKRGGLPKTELIKHGEKESILFVELSDGLTIDRKIRAESSDYFKVSKPGAAVPSTEGFLRSLIKGDIFRPGEFLKKSPEEQASIILDMLEIPWTKENIQEWFGEIPDVNYDVHILKILKQIENKYYKERAAINQQIDVLSAQAQGYRDQLPPNYDGDEWRTKKVQEYYDKVAEANEINRKIEAAKNVIENLENKIKAIRANAETDKQIKKNSYDNIRSEGRSYIQFLNSKIEAAQKSVDEIDNRIAESDKALDNELNAEILKLKSKFEQMKSEARDNILRLADIDKATIAEYKNQIAIKEQALLNIDEIEKQALQAIDEKTAEQIRTADAEAGNSKKILEEIQPIEIEPLKKTADEVAYMQSYLRDYDLMKDILVNKLAPKKAQSDALTTKIEKARSLPLELLKISKCPISGISVDDKGMLRINGTLIDGLSDGEMKDLAVKIAKSRAESGDLKIICFDGFQDLNPEEQQRVLEEAKNDGFQWFILKTEDGDLKIEIIDWEG